MAADNRLRDPPDLENGGASLDSSAGGVPSTTQEKSEPKSPDVAANTLDRSSSSLYSALKELVHRMFSRVMHNPLYARDGRYEENIKMDKMMDHPQGNPQMTFYIASDRTTRIYRKFGYLRHRVLQFKQNELAALERELIELDKKDEGMDGGKRLERIRPKKGQEKEYAERIDLMRRIDEKLAEYDALLARERDIDKFRQPTKGHHMALFNYIWNEKPVVNRDFDFIMHEGDLITVCKDEERGFLDNAIETLSDWLPPWIMQFFADSKEQERLKYERWDKKPNDKIIPDQTFDLLARTTLALFSTAIVLVPVVLLYVVKTSRAGYLGIVVGSILAFSLVMISMTQARRYEVFAVSAAYTAVLVVFLGNAQGTPQKGQ